jgi:hypothetical protein
VLRWKGGAIAELSVPIKAQAPKIRTDEDTIDLLRRLAVHYPDAKIAGILNRQGRHTARKLSFTASSGEQLTHGPRWRIRLSVDILALFVDDTPKGWLATLEATLAYGVSRQTRLQRVTRGELQAVHVRTGRRKGPRIQPQKPKTACFDHHN